MYSFSLRRVLQFDNFFKLYVPLFINDPRIILPSFYVIQLHSIFYSIKVALFNTIPLSRSHPNSGVVYVSSDMKNNIPWLFLRNLLSLSKRYRIKLALFTYKLPYYMIILTPALLLSLIEQAANETTHDFVLITEAYVIYIKCLSKPAS